jgi:hypothetical protein
MNARQRWLAAALVATLAAAFWPGREDSDGLVESAGRSERTLRPVVAAPAAGGDAVARGEPPPQKRLAGMQANLFPRQTWAPPAPPPKPSAAPPPPPPAPPPLPFKYLGRWVDAGQETVFLVQGEEPVSIRTGQVLSLAWRVDEISERKVVFTYLPLDMQSTLGITP